MRAVAVKDAPLVVKCVEWFRGEVFGRTANMAEHLGPMLSQNAIVL